MRECKVCGTKDEDKAMAFRGEEWCSDNHRKVIVGERVPTAKEAGTMTPDLFRKLFPAGVRCEPEWIG